ncbi:MAG TPA: M56 family metallopeptidase, partial [Chryseosolibacter sp.]
MENYLLSSSLVLAILFAIYKLVQRYERNHQLSRYLGLTCVVFAATFFFVEVNTLGTPEHFSRFFNTVVISTVDLQDNVSTAIAESDTSIFLRIYLAGAFVFGLRCLFGALSLLSMYFRSSRTDQWGFKVVRLDRQMSPFSFFNILFLGKSTATEVEEEAIILHEHAHRSQLHSVDVLLLELLCILFWFNPVMWLFRREIKAIHEYLADEHVLKSGIGTLEYQQLLFKTQTGISLQLGSSLSNRTSLTKRFNMMMHNKQNSKRSVLWKTALFGAIMAAILVVSGFSHRSGQVDTIAVYEQGEEAMYTAIRQKITYPASARQENRMGVVHISFTVTKDGKVEDALPTEEPKGHLLNQIVVIGYSKSSQRAKGINDAL